MFYISRKTDIIKNMNMNINENLNYEFSLTLGGVEYVLYSIPVEIGLLQGYDLV